MPVNHSAETNRLPPLILIATTLSFAGYLGMLSVQWRFGTLRDFHVDETIRWYFLAFVGFLIAIVAVERAKKVDMRWLWGAAILFRILLLFTTPTLSDDVYRYIWDGYVATEGVSPYAYPIDSAAMDPYDHPIRHLANNTWMASPYMPAAQWIFFVLATVLPLTPIFMQITMVIFDLLSAVVLMQLLAMAGLPGRRLLLYLWNPLVIVEVAHGAHIDAWMVLLTLLTVWIILKSPSLWEGLGEGSYLKKIASSNATAPVLFALATLTKIIPVLALPILFWRWTWRQLIGYGALTLVLLMPAGLRAGWGLGSDPEGHGLFGALRIYGRLWKFNSGIFHWLDFYLDKLPQVDDALSLSKLIVFLIMLTVMLIVWWRAYHNRDTLTSLRLLFIPFTAYIVLTPTVHPWYSLMMFAFFVFWAPAEHESPQRWLLTLPWLYLAATLIVSYITYRDPAAFGEREWVRQLEWLPTLALMVVMPFIYRISKR